jgi:SAM-dependent methyltransferase
MDQQTAAFVGRLPCSGMDALEISGLKWKTHGFRSYLSLSYPDFDICEPSVNEESFDFVVAEQVLEHVRRPYHAVVNARALLRPGGWFLVTTPFLVRLHPMPYDGTRWTEGGLRNLLIEAGFESDRIHTGAWGNRKCVVGNFTRWANWIPWLHSLENEPDFPLVVWAFAQRSPH